MGARKSRITNPGNWAFSATEGESADMHKPDGVAIAIRKWMQDKPGASGAHRVRRGTRRQCSPSIYSGANVDDLDARAALFEQLAAVNSADEAAAWAHRNMPAKNKLAAGAKIEEERFKVRLV
jgi:hypothetical protein